MEYIQEITLELNTLSAPVIIGAKQYDENSRGIKVSYTKNGEQYLIHENNIVRLRMRKPDGTSILDDAQVNANGTVTVIFSYQCLSAAGRAYADLMEFDTQGKLLSTASFILDIQASPNISGHNALSSDEFQSLINFINQGDEVINKAQKWANGHQGSTSIPESSSIDQPGSNNNAKYWSQQSNMWATGNTTGTPGSNNNAKYWADKAEENVNDAVTEITTDFNTQKSNIISDFNTQKTNIISDFNTQKSNITTDFNTQKTNIISDFNTQKSNIISDFNTIINSINFSIQTDMTKNDRGILYFLIDTID